MIINFLEMTARFFLSMSNGTFSLDFSMFMFELGIQVLHVIDFLKVNIGESDVDGLFLVLLILSVPILMILAALVKIGLMVIVNLPVVACWIWQQIFKEMILFLEFSLRIAKKGYEFTTSEMEQDAENLTNKLAQRMEQLFPFFVQK